MSAIRIKTGKENMDVVLVHRFLSEDSYWAKGIPYALVERSLSNSFCIGAFVNGEQVAFGRVITDYVTFGWFADFFVHPEYRGKGISKQLLSHIEDQPWSKLLRRKMLRTSDAHDLYRQYGFTNLSGPDLLMEKFNPEAHLQYKEE